MYKKVYVEITNICNMNCSFCHGHKREERQMSLSEFELILNKLTNFTEYIYYHLMGEPLMHPKLTEFIKMATERGFKSIITTNGTLLPQKAEELLSTDIHKVNISLHSFENGTSEEHSNYVSNLAEFALKASEKGTIIVFRLWNNGYGNTMNQSSLKILREKLPGEWKENSRGIKIKDKIFLEYGDRFEWPDASAEVKGEKFYCYGLKDQFGILSDGTIVPCCLDSEGIITLGNVFIDDLDHVLNSNRSLEIVNGFKRGEACEELCKRCGYAQRFVR